MTVRDAVALVLLVLGVAVVVLSCAGVLLVPGVYRKLHFAAPASSLGAVLIGLALAVGAGSVSDAFKDVFTVLVLAFTAPAVTTATARAARAHDRREQTR